MATRFKVTIDEPGASALVLTVSFEVRALRLAPTPTKARRLTVAPRPPVCW